MSYVYQTSRNRPTAVFLSLVGFGMTISCYGTRTSILLLANHGLLHYKQELEGEDHVSHRLRVTATSCHHLEIHSLRQDVGRWLRLLIGLVSLFSINHPDQ